MSYDVVIAGGAATGSSVAAHLLADPDFGGRVLVVEKDPTYRLAASALSAASVRQQYSQPVNMRLSLHGLAFLRDPARFLPVEEDPLPIGLSEAGYLYLAASDDAASALRENNVLQRQEGAEIELLDRSALDARFPWLATGDLLLGSHGVRGEGWFDGWALLQTLRRAARRLGATYVSDEIVAVRQEAGSVVEVTLKSGETVACGHLVNCAGSGGRAIAALAEVAIPVQAKRRSVFSFASRTALPGCPLLIDTSGVWMRPDGPARADGQSFIGGWSPPAPDDPDWRDDDPASQEVDWALFEEVVWPALAARIPAFEEIRPGRAWTGPYDMNLLDHNAIVGPAPGLDNFYLCNGFSGHGLQHSPGIGRGLAELIVHGRFRTIDLRELGYGRIAAGRPFLERNVI